MEDTSTSIRSLSQELILAICDILSLHDLKQLRRTCRAFGWTVGSITLRKLSISGLHLEKIVQSLRRTMQGSPAIEVTKELTLGDLSSTQSAGPQIRQGLFEVLTSLKSVTTLTWDTSYAEPSWLQETIWAVIKNLPDLDFLRINAVFLKVRLDLETLTKLKRLAIRGFTKAQVDHLFLSVAKLYASSDLNYLWIQNINVPLSRSHSLHRLFEGCPKKAPHLRQLIIDEFPVYIDQITLPHLRGLTSLSLTLVPASTDTDFHQNGRDIWIAMLASGIRLEEVQTNACTLSFSNYLATFSGLKRLELSGEWPFDDRTSDEAATTLFTIALPNHVESLEQLVVDARYEDLWCFCHYNYSVVSRCTKLRRLYMKVRWEEIEGMTQLDQPNAPAIHDQKCIVEKYIDMVIIHMPELQDFAISGSINTLYRHVRLIDMSHVFRTLDKIADRIRKYKAPLSCQYLPPLTVIPISRYPKGFQSFRGVQGALDDRLVYMSTRAGTQDGRSCSGSGSSSESSSSESEFTSEYSSDCSSSDSEPDHSPTDREL